MKITMGRKMFVSFIIIIFFVVLVGSLSVYTINSINDDTVLERENIKLRYFFAEKVTDHLSWVSAMYNQLYLGKEFNKQLDPHKCDFGKWYYSYKSNDPEIKQALEVLEEPHRKLHNSANLILRQIKAGNKQEAERIFKEETLLYCGQIHSGITALNELLAKHENEAREHADNERTNGITFITILILASSSIGIVLAALLTRSVTRPVNAITNSFTKIAEGDLSISNLKISTNDEVGIMANAFNKMIENLKGILHQLSITSQSVAFTSEQLSSNSEQVSKAAQNVAGAIQDIAKGALDQASLIGNSIETVFQVNTAIQQIAYGAQEQAGNIGVTAQMVNQMASSIQEVASSAQTVSLSAEKTKDAADKGEKAVNHTIQGMNGIKGQVYETANKIRQLGEHSQHIGEIIQVIDEIAEQTNLLALNAAIEAARAGDHGKGFAVVADEVRKLAERSGKATKEIANLITNIQTLTVTAVNAMEQATSEVENGVALALDAGNTLKEISGNVENTYQQVQNISAAAEEISATSHEVVKAIDNVSAITEENNASTEQLTAASYQVKSTMENVHCITEQNTQGAEEVSSSAEEVTASVEEIHSSAQNLAEMADNLNEIIGKFKLYEIADSCWDLMNCKLENRRKCPAFKSEEKRCWLIEGTWCGGVVQGDAKSKRKRCMRCKAFKKMTELI